MTQYSGETGRALAAARTVLADRDRALGEADRALGDVLGEAYRLAADSIRRIEAVQSAIEALGPDGEADGRSRARLLLDRHRELIAILTTARDGAAAKTMELQQLAAAAFATR